MTTQSQLIEIDMTEVDGELHTTSCRELNLTSLCDGGEACRLDRLRAIVSRELAEAGLQSVVQPIRLEVSLTGCDTAFLASSLPLQGELLVMEVGADGHISRAQFRHRGTDGTLGQAVLVDFPTFTYTHKHTPASR